MANRSRKKSTYLDQFDQILAATSENGSGWLMPVRKKAIGRFSDLGFPTTKDEEFRFTNLAPIRDIPFKHMHAAEAAAAAGELVAKHRLGEETSAELVFLNGRFSPEQSSLGSLPKGVTVSNLARALREQRDIVERHLARHADFDDRALTALNTAFLDDGVFVHIADGVVLEKPIHMLYLTDGLREAAVSHPRSLYVVGKNGQATFLESYHGGGETPYWTNAVSEAVIGENASVRHYKVQQESRAAFHVATVQARQERASHFVTHSYSFGAALARNDINLTLDGEGIESDMDGLYLAEGDQLVDHHTYVDHLQADCNSREFYKGILTDRSKGVFNGKIMVRQAAQRTDAKQTNRNLLLSEDASINAKPQLEIFADDVKCTHGATVGQIDENALFYLRVRGIDEETAQSLLIFAFAREIVERIDFEPLRTRVADVLYDRLPNGQQLKELQ